jgi:NADPH:quinone reductase-like Zn-dependent oxidoreductase
VLRYEQVLDPIPGDARVRIGVPAAGVHLIDSTIRRGAAGGPFRLPTLPMTPGREVAGFVEAVGAVGRAAFELLGRGGRLARFDWSSGTPAHIYAEEFAARGVTDVVPRIPQQADRLRRLESVALDKAASGVSRPRAEAFTLARASGAHEAVESRATTGKVVLVP